LATAKGFMKTLSTALARVYPSQFSTFLALRAAIAEANPTERGVPDRRKLARLIDGTPEELQRINLTGRELQALDHFFAQRGGLAELMSPASLLHSLAEQRRVTFLLGSPYVQGADRLSRWDVRSVVEVLRGIDQLAPGVHVDIEDISVGPRPNLDELRRQKWFKDAHADDGPSIVCIGSPRACHASEILLAEMFGTTAFSPGGPIKGRLPVGFGWTSELSMNTPPSAFALSPEEQGRARVKMVIDNREFEPTEDRSENAAYGVIFAKRRKGNQVWAVCAGHSGPGTYAAASLLRALPVELSRPPESKAHYIGVECVVRRGIDTPPTAYAAADDGPASSMDEDRRMLRPRFLSDVMSIHPA
jgi:hypothetical protein